MAARARPSQAQGVQVDFQTGSPELQQFVIPNVRPTGRELGRGSYGAVVEVEIPGATCAAKIIHETLLRFGSEDEVRNITDKFVRECSLMSSLRHPHVVLFLGVCSLPGSPLPALVMEKLLVSLHELLETNPNIPLPTKRSILHDVARGLLYLHSHAPPIIHRDLTAKNVLLNSAMVAKLADLGVARIVETFPGQIAAQLTMAPGTAVYMPPEALEPEGTYNTKLDIFSFGNVALFSLTQVFPAPKFPTYLDPTTRRRIARSEVERRFDYIQQLHEALGQQHILVRIVEQCLQDFPEDRPSIEEVVQQLEEASAQIPSQYGSEMTRLELEQENESLRARLKNVDLQQRLQPTLKQSQTVPEVASNEKQWDPSQPKQLNLKWRTRGCSVHLTLRSNIQTAVLDGNVCVKTEDGYNSCVQVYDTQEEQWNTLCCRTDNIGESAMVVSDDQLVLAGGEQNQRAKNTVAVWNVRSKTWQCPVPYPPMPTPRVSALSIKHQHYLIFVGGYVDDYTYSICSEILDTSRSQWFIAKSLPEPCRLKQCVVIGDTLYLLGTHSSSGRQLVFECSIPTLIFTATSESTVTDPTWKTLPDTQLKFCCLATYKNSLLAVGGLHSQIISGIYAYKSDTGEWSKIGELPTALNLTMRFVLPSNEFYVHSDGDEVYIGTPDSV